MEEKTAERTAYAQALTENNPTAIVAVNMDRRVEMCNPAFERLFGYSLAEILGAELDSLLAPQSLHREMLGLMGRAASGDIVRSTTKRKRKDGSLVDVQIIGVPLVVGGKRTGTFGMYEDITEKKQSEEALQKAEEKRRRIFDNAIEGFFESTPSGRYLAVNPAMARIAGYSSPAEMINEIHDIGRQIYVRSEHSKRGEACLGGTGRPRGIRMSDAAERREQNLDFPERPGDPRRQRQYHKP